jgi:hypothetical protein
MELKVTTMQVILNSVTSPGFADAEIDINTRK